MKPFWGIDVTENKKNDKNNGEELLFARVSDNSSAELGEKMDSATEIMEKAKLPLPLRILRVAMGFIALMFGCGILSATLEIGIAKAYSNAPILFWIFFISLIIWVIVLLSARKKEREVLEAENAEELVEDINENFEKMFEELNVPTDAPKVDLLLFRYKVKNGEIKPDLLPLMPTAYINVEARIFSRDGSFFIGDVETLYSVPLSSLKCIRKINKRISVPNWNKDEEYNKGEFKQYKMTMNNSGCIFFKPYYILEFEHGGELWGIYFPPYELGAYATVTGLAVIDDDEDKEEQK